MFTMIAALLFTSCSDEEETQVRETLSFKVNGEIVTIENPDAGISWIWEQLIVTGELEDGTDITIGLLNTDTGTFTEEDIDGSRALGASNYFMEYEDTGENIYEYEEDTEDSGFSITVSEFGTEEGSLVSGTFEGVLIGNFFNGAEAPDSVVISDGEFTVIRTDATFPELIF